MEHKCARMGVSGFATPHLLSRYFRGSRRRLGCVWEEKEISSTPSLPLIGRIGVSARTRSDQDCQRRRHSQCCCLGRLPAHAAPKIIKSHHSPRPPLSRVLRGSPDRRPYVSSTYVRPLFSLLYPTTSQLHPPVHRPITHTLGLAPWTQRSLQPKTINRPFPFSLPLPRDHCFVSPRRKPLSLFVLEQKDPVADNPLRPGPKNWNTSLPSAPCAQRPRCSRRRPGTRTPPLHSPSPSPSGRLCLCRPK